MFLISLVVKLLNHFLSRLSSRLFNSTIIYEPPYYISGPLLAHTKFNICTWDESEQMMLVAHRRMVLRPLEFADCLSDNPWFRQNLHEHEMVLEDAHKNIKNIESQCRELIQCSRSKLHILHKFNFGGVQDSRTSALESCQQARVISNRQLTQLI